MLRINDTQKHKVFYTWELYVNLQFSMCKNINLEQSVPGAPEDR